MPEQGLGLGKAVQVLQKGVVLFEDILICETIDINTCKQSIVASAQHSTAQQQGISAVHCTQHDSTVGVMPWPVRTLAHHFCSVQSTHQLQFNLNTH